VSGWARFLIAKGHTVTIAAAVPGSAFDREEPHFEDQYFKVKNYSVEGVSVIGIYPKKIELPELYSKEKIEWIPSFQAILENYLADNIHYCEFHGYTALIGNSLFKAVQRKSPGCIFHAFYHTAISCPKGTLLYGNKKRECTYSPQPLRCSSCIVAQKANVDPMVISPFLRVVPRSLAAFHNLPLPVKVQGLVGDGILNFKQFAGDMSNWLVFSERTRRHLIQSGAKSDKITLIRHGVSNRFFGNERSKSSRQEFIYLGRFAKIKGVFTLFKAWYSIPDSPGRRLTVIADENMHDAEIIKQFEKIAERQDVRVLRQQTQDELSKILAATDFCIIPSECVETGPLVLHEAVASGCKVIASNIGGNAELKDIYGSRVSLFPVQDAQELKKLILEAGTVTSPALTAPSTNEEHYCETYHSLISGAEKQ
jgi:glycosyltransferase involved in cell wall biosynthesis